MEVQNATPVMGQHQKHVKDLEADRGHREEVDGRTYEKPLVQNGEDTLVRFGVG
jgi:hypothetical protein